MKAGLIISRPSNFTGRSQPACDTRAIIRHLRATLIRAAGFFIFASAYWALLPLVARNQVAGGPELYGILLGAIGAGAVSAAFALPWLKRRLGADRLVAGGTIGTAVALVLFAWQRARGRACGKPDRGGLVDRDPGNHQRVGTSCFAELGARSRPFNFWYGDVRFFDARQRALG